MKYYFVDKENDTVIMLAVPVIIADSCLHT